MLDCLKNMMTKAQKIWLTIFGLMFLIPEFLWSPILNFYYELSQTGSSGGTHPLRYNFLQNSDNLIYLKFVVFIQLVAILLFSLSLVKVRKNLRAISYLILLGLSLIIFCSAFFVFYVISTFNPVIF